jgi:hypothetical protein
VIPYAGAPKKKARALLRKPPPWDPAAGLKVMLVLQDMGDLKSPEVQRLARELSPDYCPCCGLPWPKEKPNG